MMKNIIKVYLRGTLKHFSAATVDHGDLFWWATILENGGSVDPHNHEEAIVAGSYYLQMPPDAAGINFIMEDEDNQPIDQMTIIPNAYDLLLYPPWLKYEIPVAHNQERRVSLNFTLADNSYMLSRGNQKGDRTLQIDVQPA